jgi:hypothetical protein
LIASLQLIVRSHHAAIVTE